MAFEIDPSAPPGEKEAALTFPVPKEVQKRFRPEGPFQPDIPTLELPGRKPETLEIIERNDYAVKKSAR